MMWNSLFPRTWNPTQLRWPIEDLPDLTDLWILGIVGVALLAVGWAVFRTIQSLIRSTRYSQYLRRLRSTSGSSDARALLLNARGLPLAASLNEILVEVPRTGAPLEQDLKRCGHSSEVFNPSTLAHGLIGSRLLLAVPAILTGLGGLGTFIGLQVGIGALDLDSSQIENLDKSIAPIIKGCSTAFATSVWGVVCSIGFTVFEKFLEWLAMGRIRSLQTSVNQLIPRYTPEESMLALQRSAAEQEKTLTGLAIAIGEEMQKAINRIGSSITEAVQEALGGQAENLGNDAAQQMSSALTKELEKLQGAMGQMSDGFKEMFDGLGANLSDKIGGFDKVLSDVGTTVTSLQQAMAQTVDRLDGQTGNLAKTVGESAEKFGRIEVLSDRLTEASANLERSSQDLQKLAESIETASAKHSAAAEASEKAARAGERTAEKLEPLPASFERMSGTLDLAGGRIKEGAEAARDVYAQLIEHQKTWFEGIKAGLSAMRDRVQEIIKQYGDSVEGETKDLMEIWTSEVNESLNKFDRKVQSLEGAINDLTDQLNK